jgi:hypothetical protein
VLYLLPSSATTVEPIAFCGKVMNTMPETEEAVTAKTIPILSDSKQWRDVITDYLGTQNKGETL